MVIDDHNRGCIHENLMSISNANCPCRNGAGRSSTRKCAWRGSRPGCPASMSRAAPSIPLWNSPRARARQNASSHGATTVAKPRNIELPQSPQNESGGADAPQPERGPMATSTANESSVVDDLPELIPVTGPELDVIETHLGNLIDKLLLDATFDRAVALAATSNPVLPIRASRPRS